MRNVFYEITKRSLKQNKTRGIVTLLGVIISIALISGIIFLSYNIHQFMIESTRETVGNWGIAVENAQEDMIEEAWEGNVNFGVVQAVGYSHLNGGVNPQKPYIYLVNMTNHMDKIANVEIIDGRMAESKDEIVLPEHLTTNGGVNYKLGDVLEFAIGERIGIYSGDDLNQTDQYSAQKEVFIEDDKVSLKVVGICKRLSIEPYLAPGYTAITYNLDSVMGDLSAYFSDGDIGTAQALINKYDIDDEDLRYNEALLSVKGQMKGGRSNSIYVLASTLLCLVSIGICMFLYNTFAISNLERKEQYEILASVGATERQLRKIALYEGVTLALTGVPLGILLGAVGTYTIINYFGSHISDLIVHESDIPFTMSIEPALILFALLIALIVLQLSIALPAYQAGKTKPVNSEEYEKLSPRSQKNVVKQSRLMARFFGAEGVLASKNFKRNSEHYKFTIISLAMSIVLFICASGVSVYMQNSNENLIGADGGYDISYESENHLDAEEAYYTLSSIEGISKSSFTVKGTVNIISENPYNYNIYVLDDETFLACLQENNIEESGYFNPDKPMFVGISKTLIYNSERNKIEERDVYGSRKKYNMDGKIGSKKINIIMGAYIEDAPAEVVPSINVPMAIVSKSASKYMLSGVESDSVTGRALFKANNVEHAYGVMEVLCQNNGYPMDNLKNLQDARDEAASILTMMRLFSWGFIMLITLIAIANVFNTISANVKMRRLEFATLSALGMTKSEFRKMIYYECLVLGVKTLLYALPWALFGLLIMYKIVSLTMVTGFVLPIGSIIISTIMVFVVVVTIMLYATNKVTEEDPAKVLKRNIL